MSGDNLNRKIDYLRISVTDRCNLRCIYCMPPQGIINKPQEELLTFEEILRAVKIFASLEVSKVRLTGGEPLVRRGIVSLVKSLAAVEGIEEVSLTTNGALLSFYVEELKKAGLSRINISLDTLNENKFKKIARSDSFYNVLEGIDRAKKAGFYPLKLNMVVMKGINEDEINDFVDFALSKELTLRFIEFMKITRLWRKDYHFPIDDVKKFCERRFTLKPAGHQDSGPAEYYRVQGGIIGFIKTKENNCKVCARLRLTSTGELKLCLYESAGLLLRGLLRKGYSDGAIRDVIESRMGRKENVDFRTWDFSKLYMSSVGG